MTDPAMNKYRRCSNCISEGEREAEKCDAGIPRNNISEGCRFCQKHKFRPGWELQGTLFEGLATDERGMKRHER